MSGSEEENENFCYFGKPLDPYDEDSIPKRRPITVEEQIATDAQGRRRFHGAFTGGFSAGFFNTVGSLEGWLPGEFKSSRSEKNEKFTQRPRDFMDDEDLGEDGIAPQVVRATSDYNTSKKRKKQVFSDGPIPGEPVLHNILSRGNETVGYMLLKNLRIKDRKIEKQPETSQLEKTYGCQMPKPEEIFEVSEENQYEIPQVYKEFLAKPKSNTFGLGYSGLDQSRFSLFPVETKSKLVVTDKNNKKLSISGQAFGVGAFENEDDDIYMREDMSKYDFELANEKEKVEVKKKNSNLVFDMFLRSEKTPVLKNDVFYPPPQIPHSFTGKHKIKRSRFEPIAAPEEESSTNNKVNPMIRAKYLGEQTDKEYTESKSLNNKEAEAKNKPKIEENRDQPPNSSFNVDSFLTDRFVSSTKKDEVADILKPVEKMETIHGTEQMRDAARMKMFGPLTRITSDWVPCALLCKRFNVPEPFMDRPEKSRTRTKNIIFEYQKHLEENNLPAGLKKEEVQPTPSDNVENVETTATESILNPNLETTEIKTEPSEARTAASDSQPKDITDRIDLEEQQDLFKAIFMSSDSESEKEDENVKKEEILEENDSERKEDLKNAVLSDQLIPKIKPMKEGVLSGIDFHKFTKPTATVDKVGIEKEETIDVNIAGWYGPKIPEKTAVEVSRTVNIVCSGSDDEWIEKDDNNESKKKKKHKKEKKHKKDKHKKHKHEKKSRD